MTEELIREAREFAARRGDRTDSRLVSRLADALAAAVVPHVAVEPTPEQVEAAAKALRDDHANRTDTYVVPAWEDTSHGDKIVFRGRARAALMAAALVAPQREVRVSCYNPDGSRRSNDEIRAVAAALRGLVGGEGR